VKEVRYRTHAGVALLLSAGLTLSVPEANAYDPFAGHRGWKVGLGTGPANGGLIGLDASYSVWRFELGAGVGYYGLSGWFRLNTAVIDDTLIPWLRVGVAPDPYAGFEGVYTSGTFAEGGVSLCSSPEPSFTCFDAGLGAVWSIEPEPSVWPVRPTLSLTVSHHFRLDP
jgi:hypothetical protein